MLRLLLAASLAAALPQNFAPTAIVPDVTLPVQLAPQTGSTLEACAPRAPGAGPLTTPDTAGAFVANPAYAQLAVEASTPQGYSEVFENLQGSNIQDGYLQFITLSSYSTAECQQACDDTEDCTAFNIYVERDPSVEPAAACPDPSATASLKCALYSLPISAGTVTNLGQFREEFEVVIAGSNGYVKDAASTPTTPSPEDPETTPQPELPQPAEPEMPEPETPKPEMPHPDVPTPDKPVSDAPEHGGAPAYGTKPKAPSCRAMYKQ